MNTAHAIALAAFIIMLLASIAAGTRMWHMRQQGLAAMCGAIAAFTFMLGFWYLSTLP